jgi:phosphatidylglycerol lysyltransferase
MPEPAAVAAAVPAGVPPLDAGPPPAGHALRRILLSAAVAAMGVVDLLSALLSHPPGRIVALRRLVPTEVLDTSRTFTLLAGALLLVTAWWLRRGKRRAFVTALFLCALSVPVNMLKAFDIEEATVAVALLFALGLSGEAFRVKSRELSLRALRGQVLLGGLGLVAYATLGAWLVELLYGHALSWPLAFRDAAWRMFGIGAPVELVPASLPLHEQRVVTWYLGSLPLMSLVFLLGLAVAALRPATHRRRHRAQAGRVEALLREYGESTVSAFALADDADYFFSRNGRAVVAYQFESDTLLGIGDPIGPREEVRPLLAEFARFAAERDWQVAFFQARPEWLDLYRELGWRALHIGEDPVLWTDRFTLAGGGAYEARRAVKKAEAAALEVVDFRPDERPFAAVEHAEWLDDMRAISAEWLRSHVGGEKGFCMGRFDPHRLPLEWLAVARQRDTGRLEGFVTWVPIPARRGWALDLMRKRRDALPGTMELLVARSVETARARGDAMLSLSLSALAQVDASEAAPASPNEARARRFLMEHLGRFYDFKGLLQWKRKFDPSFEDRYLVYAGPLALPQVALALARAQSPGGLLSYFRRPGAAAAPPPPREAEAAEADGA